MVSHRKPLPALFSLLLLLSVSCSETDAYLDEELGLVSITAGTFLMGSPEDEVARETDAAGYNPDETQHRVTLTHDFFIGSTEVTQAQFEAYLGYNPSANSGCGADCPVDRTHWHAAAAFANAVSVAAGLQPCFLCDDAGSDCEPVGNPYDCKGYRLPTEAEWEYAARAGSVSAYPNGGNLVAGDEHNCEGELALDNGEVLDDISWYCGNDSYVSQPVASLNPNDWGLYDTSGNLWEWVHENYAEYEGDATDPVGSTSGGDRVMRGGCWAHFPGGLRSAFRLFGKGSSYDSDDVGFRIARTK